MAEEIAHCDFWLPDIEVPAEFGQTLSASRDPVTLLPEALGANPALDTFGGTPFKAESVDRGSAIDPDDHSRYYDEGNLSESLYSQADIVTGPATGWAQMACWPNRAN